MRSWLAYALVTIATRIYPPLVSEVAGMILDSLKERNSQA